MTHPITVHMHVSIGQSDLAWFVESVDGATAILTSGQTGRIRRELVANLRPWGRISAGNRNTGKVV